MPESAQTTSSTTPDRDARDWVTWYEDLEDDERRELRARIIDATPDDVKADMELTKFFLFHVEDLVHERPPGTRTIREFWHVVMNLRGREDMVADRKKAVGFMLASYQHYLRDNPWDV